MKILAENFQDTNTSKLYLLLYTYFSELANDENT